MDNLTDAHQILESMYLKSIKEKNECQDKLNTRENEIRTSKSKQSDCESEKKELNDLLTSKKSENENLLNRIRQLEMEKNRAESLQLGLSQGLSVIGL